MKLSFITVVRNVRPLLQKTLSQLLNLQGVDFEIIVVDGNSTDGTQEYLAQIHHPRLKYLSESDTGIYNAMNKGIRIAQGEFLYFLNGGDELYSVESFHRILKALGTADIYYCNILLSDPYETKFRVYPKKLDLNFWFKTHMCHQAVIFRRSLFESLGLYNEAFRFSADFDFLFRAWNKPEVRFAHIDEVLAIYDLTGTSADPKNYERVVAEYKKIQKNTLPFYTYWKAKGLSLFKEHAFFNNNWLIRKLKSLCRKIIYFFITMPVGHFDFYFNPAAKSGALKILHLSTYASGGGAAIAAVRLNDALNEIGVQSQLACMFPDIHHPAVTAVRRNGGVRAYRSKLLSFIERNLIRLARGSRKGLLSLGLNSVVDRTYLHELIRQFDPDIIHIHWINHGFLNIEDISSFQKPLVWTFHDMWPFLGSEHLASDARYSNSFRDPKPGASAMFDIDRLTYERKRRNWHPLMANMNVVCPSRWMKAMAEKSPLWTSAKMHVVANLVDSNAFRQLDKKMAREILQIPSKLKRVIVFGASSPFIEPIKGFPVFLKALELLVKNETPSDTFVITFGSGWGSRMIKGVGHKHFESTKSSELLSLIYSAADVMVVTSEIESFCLVAAEAHSCGTPVVCFDTAGLKDVVAHEQTGYRAVLNKVEDLVAGIDWVLNDPVRYQKLSSEARARAVREFGVHKVARAHLDIYSSTNPKAQLSQPQDLGAGPKAMYVQSPNE